MDNVNTNNADQVTDASGVQPLGNADVSGGFPAPGDAQQTPTVDTFNQNADVPAESVPAVDPIIDASVDLKAVNERLKQQNARSNKLMSALGIDPMSDMAEQLESGLITDEMVRNHFQGNQQQTQQPSQQFQAQVGNDPVAQAAQELIDARAAYDQEAASGEGVTLETNTRVLDAIQGNNDAKLASVTQKFTATEQAQQANANVNAVLDVARSDPHFAEMDAGIQSATELAMMSVTGVLADRGAREAGLDPAKLTPQQYNYYAGKASVELEALKQHYIAYGASQVRAGQVPGGNVNVNRQIPVPAGSGGGSVPPPANQYANANMSNHKEMALEYMKGSGQI